MVSWVLEPCLGKLFDEFDEIAPNRDHATDGAVGDTSHAASSSDHNPDETGNTPHEDADHDNDVHAIDVDKDLRADFTMEDCVQYILSECRKEGTSGKDRGRLKYIIYNKRIWKASNGWRQEAYTGTNAHVEHAHFSCEYDDKYSNDTSTWGLVDKFGGGFMGFINNQTEFNAAMDSWAKTPNGKKALWSSNHEDTVPMSDDDGNLLPDAGADSRMAPDTALKDINRNVIQIENMLETVAEGTTALLARVPVPPPPSTPQGTVKNTR